MYAKEKGFARGCKWGKKDLELRCGVSGIKGDWVKIV